MPLVPATLQADLLNVFNSMNDGDNSKFSKGIAKAIKTFAMTAMVTTTDVGTVAQGAFTGAGTGTVKADDSDCASIIQDACDAMMDGSKDDDYLAVELAKAIQKLADGIEINTTINGTIITTSSPPVPVPVVAAQGKGTIKCQSKPLESALKSCFKSMSSMTEGGNELFAQTFATSVQAFFVAGIVSTDGQGNIAGSKGTGTIA